MTAKKNKRLYARKRPTHPTLEVKVTARSKPNGLPSDLATIIDQIMEAHDGKLDHQGTSLLSGDKDFIYRFGRVLDEIKLMDSLKSDMSAALKCGLTLESFAPLDAYPGEGFMYGYPPGHLVRQRR